MPRQPMTCQFDLFSAPQRGKTAGTPQWSELPEETRQALTVLIVRLFVDHANCGRLAVAGVAYRLVPV